MCIWKILFSSYKKCYGLLHSELPLASCQPLKIQSFVFFCLHTSFLIFLSSISHERQLQSLLIILVFQRTQEDFSSALKCCSQTLTNDLLSSGENTKISQFWHFNDRNSVKKHGEKTNNPIFFISHYLIFEVYSVKRFIFAFPYVKNSVL